MKAITLWQPWASLVLVGAKPYEFRGWCPPKWMHGSRIAIHAGARPIRRSEVWDLIQRLKSTNPAINPCLHPEPALTLLERVLEGLPAGRRGSPQSAPLFGDAPELDQPTPFRLPLSCIVCTAVLGKPKPGNLCAAEFGRAGNDSDRHQHFNWGWPLTDIKPVMPHVEANGAQGFWDWRAAA